MKNFRIAVALILSLCCLQLVNAQRKKTIPKPVQVSSPDGHIVLIFSSPAGKLQYQVRFKKFPVIEPSRLGLVVNGILLGDSCATGQVKRYNVNESYPYRGVHSTAVNNYNGAKLKVISSKPFTIEARVFNDGVAFRYLVEDSGSSVIDKDTTGFVIPAGSTIWSQPNVRNYEGRYSKKNSEAFVKDDLAGPPITALLPGSGLYVAITEAGLADFAGMSLRADGNRAFTANLSGVARETGNIETPWRVIEIANDLNTLVNCDIVANVSPPFDPKLFPEGYNTTWIKPGRSVWSWLAGRGAVTLENMKRFSDLAAQLGFEYNLVDEGWGYWKDSINNRNHWDMMKELVDYSATKGVKIWVWKAYPDRRGIPGIQEPQQRREFFRKCKELGIVGVKLDFFDSENQEIINFYQAALMDAASYQLMVNFHGANKPTGESRTWPNEMTREAVRGMENRPPWAQTNTIIPFTRYLAGPADYTPIHFGDRLGEVSWAHHVASMAVFTSPFLCVGADPQSILDNPAKPMIQSIPPTWDETIVLPQSRIGELVVYARRKGETWFVAAMNGVHESKNLKLNLSFLGNGAYTLSSMKDDEDKQAGAVFDEAGVSAQSSITLRLNPEGGYIGRFDKVVR